MGIYGEEHFLKHIIQDWSYEMGVIVPVEYSVSTRGTTVTILLSTEYQNELTCDKEVMERVMKKFQWWFYKKNVVIEFAI